MLQDSSVRVDSVTDVLHDPRVLDREMLKVTRSQRGQAAGKDCFEGSIDTIAEVRATSVAAFEAAPGKNLPVSVIAIVPVGERTYRFVHLLAVSCAIMVGRVGCTSSDSSYSSKNILLLLGIRNGLLLFELQVLELRELCVGVPAVLGSKNDTLAQSHALQLKPQPRRHAVDCAHREMVERPAAAILPALVEEANRRGVAAHIAVLIPAVYAVHVLVGAVWRADSFRGLHCQYGRVVERRSPTFMVLRLPVRGGDRGLQVVGQNADAEAG